MTRRTRFYDIICITVLILAGSLITYFAMNLFWSDIANYAQKFNWPLTIATYPLFTIALGIVVFTIFIARYLRMEKPYRMRTAKFYLIFLMIISSVGLITTILSMTFVYKNALAACPFPGSLVVYLIVHVAFIIFEAIGLYKVKKVLSEDDIKAKRSIAYIIYSACMGIFTFIAFDRLGAFLISPIYIEWNRFDLLWPFLLSLIIPAVILVFMVLFRLKIFDKNNHKFCFILWISAFIVSTALMITVMIQGRSNPLLVSLISPAMPIERLATLPIDFIIMYAPIVLISLDKIIETTIYYLRDRKQQ